LAEQATQLLPAAQTALADLVQQTPPACS
jgi:hypothetical protein